MVSVEYSEAVSEVVDILNHMERIYIEKIPKRFKEFLMQNQSANYQSQLDHTKRLKDMKKQNMKNYYKKMKENIKKK